MITLTLLLFMLQTCQALSMDAAKEGGIAAASSASEKGKGIFANENTSDFKSFKSWGVSVNPNYQQSSDPKQIEAQASQKFRTDETALLIQKSHQTREMVQIDLDHIELDANGLLKNMGDANLVPEGTFEIKTCRTPGESYTRTCKRQRILKINVIPEISSTQRYCPGHAKKARKGWSFHYSHWTEHCGGCATRQVITQHKKVETLSEEWVGCEAEDKSHEEGLCELIDERPGPHNETKMIDGEPFTRDYWESIRVYKCGAKVGQG